MMAYVYLFIAIFLEVIAAITTRFTDSFTAPLPTAVTVIFAVSSYFIFFTKPQARDEHWHRLLDLVRSRSVSGSSHRGHVS